MEDFLINHQFDRIQNLTSDRFLVMDKKTKQLYTLIFVENPTLARSSSLKKQSSLLKTAKLYHKNLIIQYYSETTPNYHFSLYEPCTEPFSVKTFLDPLSIFFQLCQCVSYLHSHSIILKNLSINSILLKDRTVKLCNLETADKAESQYLDQTEQYLIEDQWKAPETLKTGRFSMKSDIYTLGLILHVLLFKSPYQNSIPPDTKQPYINLFNLTLSPQPEDRADIKSLLSKFSEVTNIKSKNSSTSSCFFSGFLKSKKSTESILKSVLTSEIKSKEDLKIENLIKKVDAHPEKLFNFFNELKKNCDSSSEIVRVRALALLFYYLQKCPLEAFFEQSGIADLVSKIMMRAGLANDLLSEVAQGLSNVIILKNDIICLGMKSFTGGFLTTFKGQNLGPGFIRRVVWYWECVQGLTELLLSFKSISESRVIRLILSEEQINIFNFLTRLFPDSPCADLQTLCESASLLFIQDNLEFPFQVSSPYTSSLNSKPFSPSSQPLKLLQKDLLNLEYNPTSPDSTRSIQKPPKPSANSSYSQSCQSKFPESSRPPKNAAKSFTSNSNKPPSHIPSSSNISSKDRNFEGILKSCQNSRHSKFLFSENESQNFSKKILPDDDDDEEEVKKLADGEKFETIYKTPVSNVESYVLRPELINKPKGPVYILKHSDLTYNKVIGGGTSCSVWVGTYRKKQVAIKKQKNDEKVTKIEFDRELQVYASINHVNLVKYFGVCLEPPCCLVLEYCKGGDLFTLLHKRKDVCLEWTTRIKILKDICCGMAHLHSHRFIHRDLKSLNLLLENKVNSNNDSVVVKISDFGLSRVFVEGEFMTGRLGTCHWMAPEVLQSSIYTLAADVYSFAIVIYEVITREYPYKGKSSDEISVQVTRNHLRPSLTSLPRTCPPQLIDIMKLCWDSDYTRRPSFESIHGLLENIKI